MAKITKTTKINKRCCCFNKLNITILIISCFCLFLAVISTVVSHIINNKMISTLLTHTATVHYTLSIAIFILFLYLTNLTANELKEQKRKLQFTPITNINPTPNQETFIIPTNNPEIFNVTNPKKKK